MSEMPSPSDAGEPDAVPAAGQRWARAVHPEPRRGVTRRRQVSSSYLIDLLGAQLEGWQRHTGRGPVSVIDVGGGTGGLAVALASQGHTVTVIDPSADALAALQRRAAEADLSDYIAGLQGDTADLSRLVQPGVGDVLVCHRVLEVVDDPAQALRDLAAVLAPGGLLSLLLAQRYASVLGHATAGDFAAAGRAWADPRLLDAGRLRTLLADAGFTVAAEHGIGTVSSHVSERHVERPERFDELYRLEAELSRDPALVSAAPLVHVLALRD